MPALVRDQAREPEDAMPKKTTKKNDQTIHTASFVESRTKTITQLVDESIERLRQAGVELPKPAAKRRIDVAALLKSGRVISVDVVREELAKAGCPKDELERNAKRIFRNLINWATRSEWSLS